MKFIHSLLLLFALAQSAAANNIVVLGDSISAAYGIEQDSGWVALLDSYLKEKYKTWSLINASISGETTAGAASRIENIMRIHSPDIVLVELGGNDGLRGLSLTAMRNNLTRIIVAAQDCGAMLVLAGVRLPPNYGPRYNQQFEDTYSALGSEYNIALIPQILDGIDIQPDLMQSDGIHPTADAQALIMKNVLKVLEPMLAALNEKDIE